MTENGMYDVAAIETDGGINVDSGSIFELDIVIPEFECRSVRFRLVVDVPTSPAFSFNLLLASLGITPALPAELGLLLSPSIFLS